MTVPPSLLDPDLRPVWEAVARRLEKDPANRGRVRLPPLPAAARRSLSALVDSTAQSLDLAVLEAALVQRSIGGSLVDALALLGSPVSPEPARRRAAKAARLDALDAARVAAAAWPEAWAPEWVEEVKRRRVLSGLDATAAAALVADVRRVIDALDAERLAGAVSSRTSVSARVLGSAHALDTGAPAEVAVAAALRRIVGEVSARAVWDLAGAPADQVSGPALTWGLPVPSRLFDEAATLGIPLHLTQLALRAHPVAVAAGSVVLVVENPSVVEAAAVRGVDRALICTNGNPSAAVQLLLGQLLDAGTDLRYHGDFDAAGLAICARMHQRGLVPWRMTADLYEAEVVAAEAAGVPLPLDPRRSPPTPWDPGLQVVFDERRAVVHEERLLDDLLSTPL